MVHLLHCTYSPLQIHPSQQKHGFLESKKSLRKNGSSLINYCAVEKDSEYEVDPDKARESLRKLDEQLQSLSKKQVNPPKIRAVDMKQSIKSEEREASEAELSGSFLASLAAGLLIFTIFYNILFLTVIKPSVDGAEADQPNLPSANVVEQTLQNFDVPLGP